MDNGLSNNTVNAIYKDSVGFIWLGTQNGFNRFDGINIEVYSAFNNETIFSICETDPVFLWIGTNFGLKKLDRRTETVEMVELPGLQSPTVVRHITCKDNILYICTDSGLFIHKDNQISLLPLEGVNSLTGIGFDTAGNYWLTSYSGLFCYNPETQRSEKFLYSPEYSALNKFYCLTFIRNEIYVGTENAGLLLFELSSKTFSTVPRFDDDCVLNLACHNNRLYVGTNGNGLKILSLDDQAVETITHDSDNIRSISSNAIYSFLYDGNTHWIGTFFAGLNYEISSTGIFQIYSLLDKINTLDLNVRSFWIGEDGNKIIGTRNGFFHVSEKESTIKKYFTENTILRSNIILNIYPWNDKYLIGTYGGGLYVFDPLQMTLSEFKDDPLFRNNSFYSFTSDKNHRIWFATLNGIICFAPGSNEISHYTTFNSGLIENQVYSILCDKDDRIWIGTAEGLCFYDSKNGVIRKNILTEDYLPDMKMIRHIYEDSDGDIWICSEKNGLLRLRSDRSGFTHYTEENLLPNIFAISTMEDNFGYIWVTTAKGMVRFDKQTNHYAMFSLKDGIPAQMFNHVVQKKGDGCIWWANEKGLIYTYPTEILEMLPTEEPIAVTSFYVGGKKVNPGNQLIMESLYTMKLILATNQDNFEIHFSELNFSYPRSNIYEYRLDDIDLCWHRIIGQNYISYADIKSGNYRFRIRKAGSSQPETVITVIKKQTYFVYILTGVCVLILLIVLYFYRILFRKIFIQKVDPIIKKLDNQEKYHRSRLKESEINVIRDSLLRYMEEERPYLNSKLKLADISIAIKYPPAKISQVLNQSLETSFTDLVNTYRIQEFKKITQSNSIYQYTLSAFSEKCGFSSRSSFFYVFKKITGQTPFEYLTEAGIIIEKDK